MNLDLITKLAKLANNNPNENEANLAARKVCKLLAEGEFKFNGSPQQKQTVPPNNPKADSRYNPFTGSPFTADMWEDMFSGFRPPPNPGPDKKTAYDYGAEEAYYTGNDREHYSRPYTYGPPPKAAPNYRKWDPHDSPLKGEGKPQRPLKCKTCGKTFMTAFVGLPEMFECYECVYNKFTEGSKI